MPVSAATFLAVLLGWRSHFGGVGEVGETGNGEDKYKRLQWDKRLWTLTIQMQKDCLAYIHPTQIRSISVREDTRLQSFPDHFVFDAPMTRMFELVGNSVNPLLA